MHHFGGGARKTNGREEQGTNPFQQQHFIENAVQALQPQVDEIIISANRDLSYLKALDFTVIEDQTKNQGPLIGIVSAAEHINTKTVVVTPCDVINIPDTYVKELIFTLELTKSDVVVAKTKQRTQHLNCAFKLEAIENLKKIISEGSLRVSDWQAQMKTSYVEFDRKGEQYFKNLNEPCDFSEAP